jgi:hypothetical protein
MPCAKRAKFSTERPVLRGPTKRGVVSARTEKVVEFFLEREAAEAMIGEVREDEPELAEELRVEVIELG